MKSQTRKRTSDWEIGDHPYAIADFRERDLQRKRERGQIACAECRRLRVKCDRKIPCQSCERKGVGHLCPTGSLATGQGIRLVLAATEPLQNHIARLSNRIHQLENLLGNLSSQHSYEHSRLLDSLDLFNKCDDEDVSDQVSERRNPPTGHVPPDMIEAFGSLSVSENGISRFFGPTGRSESLLCTQPAFTDFPSNANTLPNLTPHNKADTDPGGQTFFSRSSPFVPAGQPPDVRTIASYLPAYEDAHTACETYYEQVSWVAYILTKVQLMDEMLPAIYRLCSGATPKSNISNITEPEEIYSGPHDLAIVFLVIAIGTLLRSYPYIELAEHFHQLACAAVSLQSVLENPSLVTVQMLYLMSLYNGMAENDPKIETSMELTWSLMMMAAHLAQTIGLHRDSAKWGFSAKVIERRRMVFWQVYRSHIWESVGNGRPPCLSLSYIDCALPLITDGESECQNIMWRFSIDIVAKIISHMDSPQMPSYATIMELDKITRDYYTVHKSNARKDRAILTTAMLASMKENTLMYLHRDFFVQAIVEHPENPLKSAHSWSFLALYRASSVILKSVRDRFALFPVTCSLKGMMWTHAFSSAIVFGTIIASGPRSPLARSAMVEFEQAYGMFKKAISYNMRARRALPLLDRLREKARNALEAVQRNDLLSVQDVQDELSFPSGYTHFAPSEPSQRTVYSKFGPLSLRAVQEGQPSQPSSQLDPHNSYLQLTTDQTWRVSDSNFQPTNIGVPGHGSQLLVPPRTVANWPTPLEYLDINQFIQTPLEDLSATFCPTYNTRNDVPWVICDQSGRRAQDQNSDGTNFGPSRRATDIQLCKPHTPFHPAGSFPTRNPDDIPHPHNFDPDQEQRISTIKMPNLVLQTSQEFDRRCGTSVIVLPSAKHHHHQRKEKLPEFRDHSTSTPVYQTERIMQDFQQMYDKTPIALPAPVVQHQHHRPKHEASWPPDPGLATNHYGTMSTDNQHPRYWTPGGK